MAMTQGWTSLDRPYKPHLTPLLPPSLAAAPQYQLLYVYINDYQSGGDMWYATFGRSLISLIFASVTLLGYLSLEVRPGGGGARGSAGGRGRSVGGAWGW